MTSRRRLRSRLRRAVLTGGATLLLAFSGGVPPSLSSTAGARVVRLIPAGTADADLEKSMGGNPPAPPSLDPIVHVVQLVPGEIPNEEMESPEPSIAVNPANPLEIVASAYMVGAGDPCTVVPEGVDVGDARTGAKLLRSLDGGVIWSLHCVPMIVTAPGGVGDVSLDFDANKNLSVSFIDREFFGTLIRATTPSGFASWTVNTVTGAGEGTDAPWTAAASGGSGYAFGVSIDPGPADCPMGGIVTWGREFNSSTTTCISSRESDMQYTPHVKTAVHGDGTMYALAYRPTSDLATGDGIRADVVLRRHDPEDTPAFEALLDVPESASPATTCTKRDGEAGLRLARCILVPTRDENDPDFGNERRVSTQIAVAVSPAPGSSQRVAIVYGDSSGGGKSHMTLHSGSVTMAVRTVSALISRK